MGDNLDALTAEQQAELNERKVLLRLENEQYLRDHPELKKLLNKFFQNVFNDKPENVEEYAAKFFVDDTSYNT